ncbi:hypothetical protein SAMN05216548_102313 [Faunimonas pinastri]|uniref:Uncharacterized protein n=1 Tax=Faunimonas pinastri TaxID=1855383 RepID=A0A1H9D0S8_9HYPH|nr:hypothetical protein [Faunimonas pinastri]SEQ07065.1 hypothetical protein SAMN05216548_102313 [Faunimonas pinastri]
MLFGILACAVVLILALAYSVFNAGKTGGSAQYTDRPSATSPQTGTNQSAFDKDTKGTGQSQTSNNGSATPAPSGTDVPGSGSVGATGSSGQSGTQSTSP